MIRIVTDSSCDIPADLIDDLGITVVPLTIRFGDEEFVDKTELTNEQFWDRLLSGEGLPETAAPSAGMFVEAYERLADEGATGIFVLTLSSDLSATHQAAVIGAEKLGLDVKVLDSRSVSMGLGLQVIAAAEHAAAGATLTEIADAAINRVDEVQVVAALDTIEFLKRGGRIGGASALVAGLLDIKPIIAVRNGAIDGAGRVRTRSKAVEHIVATCLAHGPSGKLSVFGGRTPGFEEIVERISAETGHQVIAAELGAVVGTHSGPGVLGMAHLPD
jgi:DegV family protein with EDD domain